MNKEFSEFSLVFVCYRRLIDMTFMSSSIDTNTAIQQKSYDYYRENHTYINELYVGDPFPASIVILKKHSW